MSRKRNYPKHLPRVQDLETIRRFIEKIDKTPNNDGCWLWTGYISPKGYGQFWMSGRAHWAHRVSFAIFVEPIDPGMTPDHTCVCPACVNPHHLVLETVSNNSILRWERLK